MRFSQGITLLARYCDKASLVQQCFTLRNDVHELGASLKAVR